MNSVKFYPDAKEELISAIQYYENCQAGLGSRFRVAIELATQKILSSPFTYRTLKAPFRRYLVPKFPYSIVYSIEPNYILIIAIAHNKRKPHYWLKRKPY
ncbi:MAG: plasmid stabilization protein [Deltaproteobacteria bacterium]|nr:MAG: plasmid stabilization protein [Deltaproteobacteria bacterium]